MNTPSERLREERKRLGLSQEAFGALGGVKKLAQIKYEQGKRKPDAQYFEGIAAAGADVAYILTGVSGVLREAMDDIRAASEAAGALEGSTTDTARIQSAVFDARRAARGVSKAEPVLSDRARLEEAIGIVEEGLAETRRKLPPKKRAEAILAAYDLLAVPNQTRDNVIRLVRTAA